MLPPFALERPKQRDQILVLMLAVSSSRMMVLSWWGCLAALIVELDDFFQGLEAPVVHRGSRARDFPQGVGHCRGKSDFPHSSSRSLCSLDEGHGRIPFSRSYESCFRLN